MRIIFNLSVILALLLIAISVFYYFVIFLPNKEKEKLNLQRQDQINQQVQSRNQETQKKIDNTKLQNCLDDINQRFSDLASDNKFKSISLEEGKLILDLRDKEKDECFKKYPQ